MGTAIGIDLGTTNTVVAAVRDGRAITLEDEHGRRLIPSVVSFHPNGSVLVGHPAKERRYQDAANTIYSVKRLIGRPWKSPEVQESRTRFPFDLREGPKESVMALARGEEFALPEVSAFVLRRAKQIAEARLGETVDRAVITVPANFNDLQRAATKVAGKLAGLEVMRILNEPTAAALAYGQSISQSERIAIYDLGGGTFDITLLDLSGSVFEVLATAGDTALGGDDIDVLIADRIAAQFREIHRFDARANPEAFGRLRLLAEDLKIRLSEEEEVAVNVSDIAYGEGGAALSIRFVMNRAQLEHLTKPLIDKTIDVTRFAIDTIGQKLEGFDRVILVGGSTRMPLVARSVEKMFGKPPYLRVNPDEVVALGAAIQAYSLEGTKRAPSPSMRGASQPDTTMSGATMTGITKADITQTGITQVTSQTQVSAPPPQRPAAPVAARGAVTSMGMPPPLPPTRPRLPSIAEQDAFAGFEDLPRGPAAATPPASSGFELDEPGSQHEDPSMSFQVKEPELDEITFSKRSPSLAFMEPGKGLQPPAKPPVPSRSARPEPPKVPRYDEEDPSMSFNVPDVPNLEDEPSVVRAPAAPAPPPRIISAPPKAPAPREDRSIQSFTMPLGAQPPPAALQAQEPPVYEPPAYEPEPPPIPQPPPSTTLPLRTQPPGTEIRAAEPPAWEPASPPVVTAPMQARDGIATNIAPLLIDVTPLSLSVETVGGYCDTLIPANSPVPCDRTRTFLTASDGQTQVYVNVSQGESRRFGENTFLGQLELSGLEPKKRGELAIAVTFEIDADGILNVRALDVASGRARQARMRLLGGTAPDEMSAMLARQAQHEVH
jgi:molecular chaperone DnaK